MSNFSRNWWRLLSYKPQVKADKTAKTMGYYQCRHHSGEYAGEYAGQGNVLKYRRH